MSTYSERNIVAANGWFDELHAQNRGFGDVAKRFIVAIRDLHTA